MTHSKSWSATLEAVRGIPCEAQPAAVLDDGVACAASAYVKVARLRFVDADLLGGSDDGAGVACFDKDAAADYGRSDESAADKVEHADGGGGPLRQREQLVKCGGKGRGSACSRIVQSRSRVSTTSPADRM